MSHLASGSLRTVSARGEWPMITGIARVLARNASLGTPASRFESYLPSQP